MGLFRMKRNRIWVKIVTFAAMTAAVASLAACKGTDDSEKVYLDEIKTKDYIKLGEYKGLEITQTDTEVTDEMRDSYINYLLSLNPEEGVKEGDTVNIDYAGMLDGVAFEGGTAAGANLTIGSGQFIPGFEEALVGAKVGETRDIDLTFPEDYHAEDLAGKAVVFTVTVNTIMAATPQELTDEYVQGLGLECSTVTEYQKYVYDMMYEEQEMANVAKAESSLASAVVEKSEFIKEPPVAMLERYETTLTENLTYEAANYGMDLNNFMQLYYGMDAATYPQEIKNQALNSAKQYIALKAIADAEDLNISDEELQEKIEQMASEASYDSVEEFKEKVNAAAYKEYMMGEKVLDMLYENAVITQG